MSKTYYKSAVTGNLLPEADLFEVPVMRIQAGGHSHFKTERVDTAYVEKDKINSLYTSIEVLSAFGEPVMVYKADKTSGGGYPLDHFDADEQEMWKNVVEFVCD